MVISFFRLFLTAIVTHIFAGSYAHSQAGVKWYTTQDYIKNTTAASGKEAAVAKKLVFEVII